MSKPLAKKLSKKTAKAITKKLSKQKALCPPALLTLGDILGEPTLRYFLREVITLLFDVAEYHDFQVRFIEAVVQLENDCCVPPILSNLGANALIRLLDDAQYIYCLYPYELELSVYLEQEKKL